MKRLFSFFLVVAMGPLCQAQFFTVRVTVDSVKSHLLAGGTSSFDIEVTPKNGFSSSIYFSVTSPCFIGNLVFAKPVLNTPYQGQSLKVEAGKLCPSGYYPVIVKGYNGTVSFSDTFSIKVTGEKKRWEIIDQSNSPIQNTNPIMLFFDSTKGIYFNTGYYTSTPIDKKFLVGHFDSTWSTRTTDSLFHFDNCGSVQSKIYQHDGLSNGYSIALYAMGKNRFYFQTYNGLLELDHDYRLLQTHVYPVNAPFYFYYARIDQKQRLWLIGDDQMAVRENDQWQVWNANTKNKPAGAGDMAEQDEAGNYWFAGGGLFKYDGQFWIEYSANSGMLKSNSVLSFVIRGNKIFGVTEKSLFVLEQGKVTEYVCPFSISTDQKLHSLFLLNENDILTGLSNNISRGGLVRFKEGKWYLYNSETSDFPACAGNYSAQDERMIRSLGKDKEGMVWLSVNGCGLVKFDPAAIGEPIVTSLHATSENTKQASVVPNPSLDGSFRIKTSAKVDRMEVIDLQGTIQRSVEKAEVSGLKKGVYVVKIYSENNDTQTLKAIIAQ